MQYSQGSLPEPMNHPGHAAWCAHCGASYSVSRWDQLCGFVVQCSQCGGNNGKHWNFRLVLFAAGIFNVLSFFFLMRPRDAFMVAGIYGILFFAWVMALNAEWFS